MAEATHPRAPNPTDSNPTVSRGLIGDYQVPDAPISPNFAYQVYPILYQPMLPLQNEEQDLGPGIYAVPTNSFIGMMAGYAPNSLIPLKYHIPTRENQNAGVGEEQGAGQPQQGPHRQQPQQVVVRRFQFQLQLDLALIIKLAAVVFLFSQEGSRQRLFLLTFFAFLIYLYQTGTLAPLLRWLRQAARPPPPPARAENRPLAPVNDVNIQRPEENGGAENPNPNPNPNPDQAGDIQDQLAELNPNPNPNPNPNQEGGNHNGFWNIVKEIQMIVVGFVASLLPGFQHND